MQWFKVPPQIYFEEDSIQYLEKDAGHRTRLYRHGCDHAAGICGQKIFILSAETACVLPFRDLFRVNPILDVSTIRRGVEAMRAFNPM